jgi:hypothetical protein
LPCYNESEVLIKIQRRVEQGGENFRSYTKLFL